MMTAFLITYLLCSIAGVGSVVAAANGNNKRGEFLFKSFIVLGLIWLVIAFVVLVQVAMK